MALAPGAGDKLCQTGSAYISRTTAPTDSQHSAKIRSCCLDVTFGSFDPKGPKDWGPRGHSLLLSIEYCGQSLLFKLSIQNIVHFKKKGAI